jgi:hypothetical protein
VAATGQKSPLVEGHAEQATSFGVIGNVTDFGDVLPALGP